MSEPLGCRRWVIAEGYIPSWSNGPEPQFNFRELEDVEARLEALERRSS